MVDDQVPIKKGLGGGVVAVVQVNDADARAELAAQVEDGSLHVWFGHGARLVSGRI